MDLDLRAVFESEEGRRWLAAGDVDAFMAGVAGLLSATSEYPHPMTPRDVPQDGQDAARRNLETFRPETASAPLGIADMRSAYRTGADSRSHAKRG